MYESTEAVKQKVYEGYETAKEKAKEVVDAAKEKFDRAKENVVGGEHKREEL